MNIQQTIREIPYLDSEAVVAKYAPYDRMAEFWKGLEAGYLGTFRMFDNRPLSGVDQQAFDRGLQAGVECRRGSQWVQDNVGAN